MAIAYTAEEREALNAKAQGILDAYPDVGSFIRRSLARDPEAETVVCPRTALEPAPVVTRAREFQGLLNSATRWLRRHGVGPGDVVSLLAPNCTATSVAYSFRWRPARRSTKLRSPNMCAPASRNRLPGRARLS